MIRCVDSQSEDTLRDSEWSDLPDPEVITETFYITWSWTCHDGRSAQSIYKTHTREEVLMCMREIKECNYGSSTWVITRFSREDVTAELEEEARQSHGLWWDTRHPV